MGSAVLAARVVLAAVFFIAAVGKLLDLPGSRRALVDFGVPERMAPIAGTLLPFVELATAIALVLRPSATGGAIAALVLLAAFVAGIVNALRAGSTPDCHCFGAIHSAPAGRSQIARNVALAALAGLTLGGGPGPALDSWIGARSAAVLVAVGTGAASIILAVFAFETWRENRRLRDQLATAQAGASGVPPGLRVGSIAPEFAVPDQDGATITLESQRARGLPVALVFVAAGCGPCESLLPELERLQATVADRLTVAFVGRGSIAHYERLTTMQGGDLMLADARTNDRSLDSELEDLVAVFGAYRLRGTPSAVIVTPEGTIASATVDGRPAIEALIRLALAGPIPRTHGAAAVAQTLN